MASYQFSDIVSMLHASPLQQHGNPRIDSLLTDSRKLLLPGSTLFFAISSEHKDANTFIHGLYEKGVRCFVTDKNFSVAPDRLPEASIIAVDNVVRALQQIAMAHRHQFSIPVVGITGSNGKTIVKEWLFHLVSATFNPVQSPKSYNSQVGVPLSVWQLNEGNDLAIFEAGISKTGEMNFLQQIIDPEIGILTCIGEAHAKGFKDRREKTFEKLGLFKNSRVLIYGADDGELDTAVKEFRERENPGLELLSWGRSGTALIVKKIEKKSQRTRVDLTFQGQDFHYVIPFIDDASVSNSISCCACLLCLKMAPGDFVPLMEHLRPVEMRMELKHGMNNCTIINDSYSVDIHSLSVALDFLTRQQSAGRKTVILSDLFESGKTPGALYAQIASILEKRELFRFIGIGPRISAHAGLFNLDARCSFYETTEAFLDDLHTLSFSNETILLKGARVFRFEKISHALQQKLHETILEINLHALRHNLKVFREFLKPQTRIMAMVKAFSYGSGSFEIANLLQHAGVEYLAVAYADEGTELRKAGISLPIMVMNPEEASFEQLISNRLEPEIFSFQMLQSFRSFLALKNIKGYPVHIELDTGMHRLGFTSAEISDLCRTLADIPEISIRSVFSHLAASSDEEHDAFTKDQQSLFEEMSGSIHKAAGYDFLRHLANSGAIHRHPATCYDMVRLGIGLYGIDPVPAVQQQLQNVTNLKTTISQIKKVKAGESIGYSRKGHAEKDMMIAIVRIGYADGYPRILSNGRGKMLVQGTPAPVVGNICMDMTMLDVTGIDAAEGDEVTVFGEFLPVRLVAEWAQTIPYEILTGISQRVHRVYFEE